MVVAMRNEIATIGRCLASLAAQDHPSDRLEVLVYDGGSTDGSMELATELVKDHPGWAVRPNPRRIQAAAWNLGIDAATGTYTGIVSGHAELDAGYVTASLAAIQETGATMVGGPVRAIGEGAIGKAVAAALSSPFGVGGAPHHYLTEREEVDTVFMGFCRTDTYRRFRFDETMVRNQDDELSYRILDAGGRIVCDPAIISSYRSRATLPGLWKQFFDYGRWKVRVLSAHPRQAKLRHLVPVTLVLALLTGIIASLWLPVARVGTLALFGLYGAATMAAALRVRADLPARARLALLLVFPTMHLAYGTGMIEGAIRFLRSGRRGPATKPAPSDVDSATSDAS